MIGHNLIAAGTPIKVVCVNIYMMYKTKNSHIQRFLNVSIHNFFDVGHFLVDTKRFYIEG